jgi:4-diphosphocytidyl-2-C-methyl-D-erythritol kinase
LTDAGRFAAPGVVHRAAPAKLNLYLHVIGRRADGYHELDSLLAFAAIHDTVSAAPGEGLALTVAGPFAVALGTLDAEDNLVLVAARRLAAAAGVAPRAALRLVKRLPVASGIGGGSADAAAALQALAALWRIDLGAERLAALALALGADVPACLHGRAAYLGDIGERLDRAPTLPAAPLVLINPLKPLLTRAVFAARHGPFSKHARLGAAALDTGALARELADRRNDLAEPAMRLMPEIGRMIDALQASPGCRLARMSGSGATCFGLFERRDLAAAAAKALGRAEPGWWVCETELIDTTERVPPALTLA